MWYVELFLTRHESFPLTLGSLTTTISRRLWVTTLSRRSHMDQDTVMALLMTMGLRRFEHFAQSEWYTQKASYWHGFTLRSHA